MLRGCKRSVSGKAWRPTMSMTTGDELGLREMVVWVSRPFIQWTAAMTSLSNLEGSTAVRKQPPACCEGTFANKNSRAI